MTLPDTSVITVNYDGGDLLPRAFDVLTSLYYAAAWCHVRALCRER